MTIEVEWLEGKSVDEETLNELAVVGSRAFDNDVTTWVNYGGINRSQDQAGSERLHKTWLKRALRTAILVVSNDRKALHVVWPPGVPNRTLADSGGGLLEAADWLELADVVDLPAWRERSLKAEELVHPAKQRHLDGASDDACWRSAYAAVDPEYQGKGYGRALNAAIIDRVRDSGNCRWQLGTFKPSFFERCGLTILERVDSPEQVSSPRHGPKAWYLMGLASPIKPKGPSMQWLEPTEEQIRILANAAARAFCGDIANHMGYCGVNRLAHPAGHQQIFEVQLRRGLRTGRLAASTDLKCCRLVWPPGQRNLVYADESGRICEAQEWLDLGDVVDLPAYRARCKEFFGANGQVAAKHAVDPVRDCWKTAYTVVDPELQGKNYGKAMNMWIADEIRKDGRPWYFGCFGHTVPFYEKCGATKVEQVYHNITVPKHYKGARREGTDCPEVYWMRGA